MGAFSLLAAVPVVTALAMENGAIPLTDTLVLVDEVDAWLVDVGATLSADADPAPPGTV